MATITEVETDTQALLMFTAVNLPIGDTIHATGETPDGHMESTFTRSGETEIEISQTLNGEVHADKAAWTFQAVARYGVIGLMSGNTREEIGLSDSFYVEHLSEDDKEFTATMGLTFDGDNE